MLWDNSAPFLSFPYEALHEPIRGVSKSFAVSSGRRAFRHTTDKPGTDKSAITLKKCKCCAIWLMVQALNPVDHLKSTSDIGLIRRRRHTLHGNRSLEASWIGLLNLEHGRIGGDLYLQSEHIVADRVVH